MYLPLSLKEQAMVVAVKENLQLEDLPKTRFIVTILTLFLMTINYQVPCERAERPHPDSRLLRPHPEQILPHSTGAALVCNRSTEKMCTACGEQSVVGTMMRSQTKGQIET